VITAMQVLHNRIDQRPLPILTESARANESRHLGQPDLETGALAPLPSDQLVDPRPPSRARNQRLQQPAPRDRRRESLEPALVETLARLEAVTDGLSRVVDEAMRAPSDVRLAHACRRGVGVGVLGTGGVDPQTRLSSRRPSRAGRGLSGDSRVRDLARGVTFALSLSR
jgi:hypothetical protein